MKIIINKIINSYLENDKEFIEVIRNNLKLLDNFIKKFNDFSKFNY